MSALRPIKVIISGVDKFSATLGKVSKDLATVGNAAKGIGSKMTMGLTLPTIAFGGYIIKTAADFEIAMNKVRALTGATGDEFKALSKQARFLGATTQFSAHDAADAMGFLGLAGFKTSEIMGAMPGVLTLASSAQLDMGQAASIAADTLRGFGLAVSDLAHVDDVMVKTFTSSNQTLIDLGEAFSYVGNVASKSGLSFEETSAALAILANNGLRATVGGTALRGILTSLLVPSGEAVSVLNRLGIPKKKIIDSQGRLLSMKAIIGELARTGANTSDVMTIFGERAGPGMLALLKGGIKGVSELETSFKNAGGVAERVGAVQMSGFTGQIRDLQSSFEELRLRIADSGLLGWAAKAVTWLTHIIDRVSEFSPALMRIVTVGALIAAALGPVIFIFGSLLSGIAALAPILTAIAGLFATTVGPIALVVAACVAGAAVFVTLLLHSKTFLHIWGKLVPFFRLAGLVLGVVFGFLWKIAKVIAKFSFKVLVAELDILLKPLSFLLDLITKLAGLALPDWLQKKIGLNAEVASVAEGTKDLAGKVSAGAGGKAEVHVKFSNAPKGTQVQQSRGGFGGLSTELGMGYN